MKKCKGILAVLATICAMSMFAACNFTSTNSSTGDSTPDSTATDTGSSDTGSSDTGSSDTGSSDTGSSDTGSDVAQTYTVKFVDEDGTLLSEETYESGATVTVPTAPEKAADNTYTYTFAGWDKEVVAVTESVTYTATYTSTYINYTIKFVNEDGDVILEKTDYHYGDEVTVPTPEKAADNTYTYTFAGWDKEVSETVAGDATYTASFTSAYIDYTVKFVDEDGSAISENTYHYGDEVTVPEATSKAATEFYTFAFAGWDKEVVAVAGDATYTATYTATLKEGINANMLSAGVGDTIVLGAGSIGGGANYTQGDQVDAEEEGEQIKSYVNQAYLALDGSYNLDDYVAFDFTGKNMPEIAFFANNYNNSMYAEGTKKQGIVVYTGITDYQGNDVSVNVDKPTGEVINYGFPYMLQDAASGGFCDGAHAVSALGRANLVDGTHYRVIMGFTGSGSAITLNWYLYNLDTKEVVEQSSMTTWNFFTGSNEQVGNMTINDLVGSVVLYGKFGTACTLDKVYGVFENTTIENIANGLGSEATYTVTFKDANGETLSTIEDVAFGEIVSYDGELPTPEVKEDKYNVYSYVWDKAFARITGDTEYTLTVQATLKSAYKGYKTTINGESIVLGASGIGDGANYTIGQNNGGYVDQSYFGIEGSYALNNYVVLDFTGKNLPEIAFFANNYNNSMYAEGTNKQGIVVYTGITDYQGNPISIDSKAGTYINYGFPYMIQDAASGAFTQGAFAESKLGRANLVDGTHYRVIMGFTGSDSAITLNWWLYNLDTKEVVEQSSMTTWNFFTGSLAQVGNMTINDLSGSIVLYGKFGASCTIDKLYGVESGAFADVVAKYTATTNS